MNRSRVSTPLKFVYAIACLSFLTASPALAERPSINALNTRVNQLEAENSAQQAEIDALNSDADTAPIVIDATGAILGSVIGGNRNTSWTQVDLPGLPLFLVQVDTPNGINSACRGVEFESTDCTGQAWLDLSGGNPIWGNVASTTDASGQNRLFYVGDPSDSAQAISQRSTKGCTGGCQSQTASPDQGFPVTPVDLDAMFTPPFHVTTRERMQALP